MLLELSIGIQFVSCHDRPNGLSTSEVSKLTLSITLKTNTSFQDGRFTKDLPGKQPTPRPASIV